MRGAVSDVCLLPSRHEPRDHTPAQEEERVDGEGDENERQRGARAREGAQKHRGHDRDGNDEHAVGPQPPRFDTPRAQHEVGEHESREERPRDTRKVHERERAVVAQSSEYGKEDNEESVGREGPVLISHPATLAPSRGVKLREGP